MRICKRCVLPENFPHVNLDESGICNYCRSYRGKNETEKLKQEYKRKFEVLIKKKLPTIDYDVLFCYSGGKDSTYTLSLLKNVYKMNILALTIDNGFIPERTYVNIRNVVESLDVDHMLFKPRFDILKKLFQAALKKPLYPAKTIERASTVCTTCMGLVKYISFKIAIEKNIPFQTIKLW